MAGVAQEDVNREFVEVIGSKWDLIWTETHCDAIPLVCRFVLSPKEARNGVLGIGIEDDATAERRAHRNRGHATAGVGNSSAKGIGDRFPNALGLKGHHDLSHSAGKENGYENWALYDQFLSEQFAYFIRRLHNTPDPESDGSLLDNTMVLYGCGTSRTHKATNYPLILAGAKNMKLKHGQHRRFDESKTRMSNLYVTMLRQLGVPIDHFADSNGSINKILS